MSRFGVPYIGDRFGYEMANPGILVSNANLGVSEWVIDWLIYWVSDWLSDWLIEWLIEWLIDWVIEWGSERASEWVTGFGW